MHLRPVHAVPVFATVFGFDHRQTFGVNMLGIVRRNTNLAKIITVGIGNFAQRFGVRELPGFAGIVAAINF